MTLDEFRIKYKDYKPTSPKNFNMDKFVGLINQVLAGENKHCATVKAGYNMNYFHGLKSRAEAEGASEILKDQFACWLWAEASVITNIERNMYDRIMAGLVSDAIAMKFMNARLKSFIHHTNVDYGDKPSEEQNEAVDNTIDNAMQDSINDIQDALNQIKETE